MPDLWVPGAAEPSLDDFVVRVHRQIEQYTATHTADQSHVEVELADGERLSLQALSSEPGYGFLTLTVPEGNRLIVPIARRTDGASRPPTLHSRQGRAEPGLAAVTPCGGTAGSATKRTFALPSTST